MPTAIATTKEIKIRMLERDTSVKKIATRARVDPSAIRHALAGRTKSLRLRTAITSALGMTVEQIWGD